MKHFFQTLALASLLSLMPLLEGEASLLNDRPWIPPSLQIKTEDLRCPAPLKTNFCKFRGDEDCSDGKLEIFQKLNLQTILNQNGKAWCSRES